MGRDRETWGGTGRHGEGQGDTGRDRETWGGTGRHGKGQGDIGRDRETWGKEATSPTDNPSRQEVREEDVRAHLDQ